jgi:SAM-dependent methyltransferase
MSLLVPPRQPSKELLDEDLPSHDARASLRDIEWVHRRLGGRWMLRSGLAPLLKELGPGSLTLLDVGCGSGHVARDLEDAPLPGVSVRVLGADIKLAHVGLAPRGRSFAGDVVRLPLADRSVDVVFSTLFLHHFAPDELAKILAELGRVARRAVVAFDLVRSRPALFFISLVGPLFFESHVSVADGRASVRQAYTASEARALAARALPGARVFHSPFVWRLVWRRA